MDISKQQSKAIGQQELDFEKADDIACDECGKRDFIIKYQLKRFSAFLSPSGNEMIVPMQVFSCSSCGHINSEFLVS